MKYSLIILSIIMTFACSTPKSTETAAEYDPLPSWNKGNAKYGIMSFVKAVTDENNPTFIPEPDRIAVFDNDGTLWSEQPMYFQVYFMLDRIKQLAPEHPEWQTQQPFKAALDNDFPRIAAYGKEGLIELLAASHGNLPLDEFQANVKEWISTAKHPLTGKKFTEMVYQPMLEVLDFMRANGFKTYIVSGGGIEFLRPWTEEVYGISAEQVIGSSMKQILSEEGELIQTDELASINDQGVKVLNIEKHIGKRPIAAFGNSDGDLAMLHYSDDQEITNFQLFVHHTDSVREWAYDSLSNIGQLKLGFTSVLDNGWMIADIARDWKFIYPYELDTNRIIQ